MERENQPTSKRWIWITAAAIGFLGWFSWLYLRDDELLPDGDLIRERAAFTEEENGYALVMGLGEDPGFNEEDEKWLRKFLDGAVPWDGERAARMLGEEAAALDVLRTLEEKRVIAEPAFRSYADSGSDHLRGTSFLGSLNALAISQAAATGDAAAVVEGLRAGRRLAEQVESGRQSMVDVLVGRNLRLQVLRGLEVLAHSPLFENAACRTEALAALEGWDPDVLLEDAVKDEYRSFKYMLIDLKAGKFGSIGGMGSVYIGGYSMSGVRLKVNRTINLSADHVRRYLAVEAETWKEAKARLPQVAQPRPVRERIGPNGTGEALFYVTAVTGSVYGWSFKLRSRMEMSRALLALRDYQEKHGVLPATLDELVPDYLEAVPKDWMDGKPIRYDAARGVLWSIGVDLTDDGGKPKRSGDDCVRIPWVVPPEDGE